MKIASDEKLAHTIGVRLVCMEMCEWMGRGGGGVMKYGQQYHAWEWSGEVMHVVMTVMGQITPKLKLFDLFL
jgi:hypothetical protein